MAENLNRKYITLDEQKKMLVDLLLEFDRFCRENNLKYYLAGGSLLGAIRHGGFIPWDDDIDVLMFRDEYDKFLKIYSPSSSRYKLHSLEHDDEYFYPFAKLVNDETVLIETKNDPENLGVYLDIFPLDNCPGERHEEASQSVDNLKTLRWLKNFKIIEFSKERKFYKNIALLIGKIIASPFTRREIAKKIDKKAAKDKNCECKFVGELVNTSYGHKEVYDKSYFGEGTSVTFEGYEFNAPTEYDAYLTWTYGDYMKLPPIEKRVSHHSQICWYK